jgi:ring-1,2-phenylacetyl-CoA epoxidase subunit PaaD
MVKSAPGRDEIFEILDWVMDPEVPVLSVVELGIVRDARTSDAGEVTVVITPTYSGCPAMRAIEQDITAALRDHGVEAVRIETVHAPAWTSAWLSDASKEKLRAYGIAAPGHLRPDNDLVPLTRRAQLVECPYCGSRDTEMRSEFGSTACKSILYCRGCHQPFEQFKAI